jgi:hypothetical protein
MANEANAEGQDEGSSMIGKKVRVFWPVDQNWYTGTVLQYDPAKGEHLLLYGDGDSEWVKIGENTPEVVGDGSDDPIPSADDQASPTRSGGPDAASRNHGPDGAAGMSSHAPPYPYAPNSYPPNMMFPPPYGMYPGPPMMYNHGMPVFGHPATASVTSATSGTERSNSVERDNRSKNGPKVWSKQEDALLLSLVQKMRIPMKWSVVAQVR